MLLKSRSPAMIAPRIVSGPTLLTGICFCAACGGAMTLRTGKSGRYRYYTCCTKARQGNTGCPGRTVCPTRFERVTFASGARRLRANGQTDGWPAHLASDAGTACRRSTRPGQCGCIEPSVAPRPMQLTASTAGFEAGYPGSGESAPVGIPTSSPTSSANFPDNPSQPCCLLVCLNGQLSRAYPRSRSRRGRNKTVPRRPPRRRHPPPRRTAPNGCRRR